MTDFSNLTKAQIHCMNYYAFNGYAGGSCGTEKTRNSLIANGFLLVEHRVSHDRFGSYAVPEYYMPLHVHMAWCFHIAKDGDDAA